MRTTAWIMWMVAGGAAVWAQAPATQAAGSPKVDRATAYYHYTLGHMYAELAGVYGSRSEYLSQAIDNYKLALKADPTASTIAEELTDVYIQSGRFRELQTEAEAALKQNPNDLSARRMLARVYLRQIGDQRNNRIDESMLKQAIEQFAKITELDPKDVDAFLMLGRLHKVEQNSSEAEKAYQKALEIDPDNEEALNGLALVYADLGDNARATALLKQAAEKNPNANSLQLLAGAYEQMRDFNAAADVLSRAIDMDPPNADELRRSMAQDLISARRYDDALKVFEDMVAQEPGDSQSWLRISQINLQKRDFAKAREAADKARALEPNSVEIKYNDVSILEAEGKTTEAIQALKDVLSATEKRSYSQGERANRLILLDRMAALQRNADMTDAAVDTLRQMGTLDPDSGPRASAEIIETYRNAKQFPKAQSEADSAGKKWPDDRTLRFVRATLQAEMGKSDAAATDVKKLLGGKDDKDVLMTLAQIYDKGRKWDEEAKVLDQLEKLADSDDEKENIWFMRGAMFEKTKNIDAAEKEFRKVLASSPDNAGALNYLSYMLADRNLRLQEAQGYIEKALEQEPNNGAYLDTLGWLYYRQGKLSEAEDYLTRALDKVPHDPTMRDHLAEVLYQRQKIKEAVTQWEASLREWQSSSPAEMDQSEMDKVRNKLETARRRLANAR